MRSGPYFALALLFVGGCTTLDDDFGQVGQPLGFDVNVSLTAADGGSDDGTVIWEIVEANATATADFEIIVPPAADGGSEVYAPDTRTPAYSFYDTGVYAGTVTSGSLMLLTSPEQQSASPLRKASIAMLLSGACQ